MAFIVFILLNIQFSWASSSTSFEDIDDNTIFKVKDVKPYTSDITLQSSKDGIHKIDSDKSFKSDSSLKSSKKPTLIRRISKRIINPFKTIDSIKNYTPRELSLIEAEPISNLFLDETQPHGLNLQNIHERCWLIRQVKEEAGGKDFSNLIIMLEGTVSRLQEKKIMLEQLENEKNPTEENHQQIKDLKNTIQCYKISMKRSFKTISNVMNLPIDQIELLIDRAQYKNKIKNLAQRNNVFKRNKNL